MNKSLQLGKLSGIDVFVHWSFALLIPWLLYIAYTESYPLGETIVLFILVACIFGCVLLHELGHALAARRYGIPTSNIILLPIGGVAQLEWMPEKPKQELIVAVAGPLVNVIIIVVLAILLAIGYIALRIMSLGPLFLENEVTYFFFTLMAANGILVAFNAIPAFPMDGGRVLRSLLAMKMTRLKATQIAVKIGQAIAIGFILASIFWNVNPFLAFIGLFVIFAAGSEERMVRVDSALAPYSVKDIMRNDLQAVDQHTKLSEISTILAQGKDKNFLVMADTEIVGTLSERDIMRALNNKSINTDTSITAYIQKLQSYLSPHLPATEGYRQLQTTGADILPVRDNNQLIGFVERTRLVQFVKVMLLKNESQKNNT